MKIEMSLFDRYLALPLLMLQKWRWRFSDHLLHLDAFLRDSRLPFRGVHRPVFGRGRNDDNCPNLPNLERCDFAAKLGQEGQVETLIIPKTSQEF